MPTSICWDDDQLLVTVFSGFPFVAGLSEVRAIDSESGDNVALITGLTGAIDVIALHDHCGTAGYLTLEYSLAQLVGGPGRLQLFDEVGTSIAVLSGELITPSSMVYDRRSGTVTVAEINLGDLVLIPLPDEVEYDDEDHDDWHDRHSSHGGR